MLDVLAADSITRHINLCQLTLQLHPLRPQFLHLQEHPLVSKAEI